MKLHNFDDTAFCHGCMEYIESAAEWCVPKTEQELKERAEEYDRRNPDQPLTWWQKLVQKIKA
jgi:hypothetical protein